MQPTGGFAWVQAAPGAALVCRPLGAIAQHLYTTREWALGSPSSDLEEAWDEVARAAGVDRRHLVRGRPGRPSARTAMKSGRTYAGISSTPVSIGGSSIAGSSTGGVPDTGSSTAGWRFAIS